MGAFLLLLIPLAICLTVAGIVYKKKHAAGQDAWGWAIISFLITAAVIVAALFALFMYAFSFERG